MIRSLSVFFVALFFLAASLNAQYKKLSKLTEFNGGYASLTAEDTGHNLTGYMVEFSYIQTALDGKWGGGVMIGFVNSQDQDARENAEMNFSTVPVAALGQLYFGGNVFQGYVQGQLGLQFSRADYVGERLGWATGDAGLFAGLGLGGHIFLSEQVFVNIAYNFSYLSNSAYRDGIAHLFKLGIGFQND